MNIITSKIFTSALFFIAGLPGLFAREQIIHSEAAIFHPVATKQGMVSSQEALATRAGLEVLKEGGNAVDAAVTVGFTLAVTLPRAGNIGGGGFMIVHLANEGETVAIDYREKAPGAARRDMFLDENGDADPQKSRYSHLAVGVPGTVRGLAMALEKYGTISLSRALQPAIELAENGFPVTDELHRSMLNAKEGFSSSPAAMKIYYKRGGSAYQPGEIWKQADLARSLRSIARDGPGVFYEGWIARKIVAEMKANGGLISREDLSDYNPVLRQPVRGVYRGYEIVSMPPPSSGGVHLIQMLNLLEPYPLGEWGHNSAASIHLLAECMKRAYADRSRYLGDPDFNDLPVAGLISKAYADTLRRQLDLQQATPSDSIQPGKPMYFQESSETTHFSVIDRWGNAVANTYTLNFSYGSRHVVPETGILLNNEMDDFSAKPGVPNAYGLIGGKFNAVAPGKRMLSSMTPTIVLKDGQPFIVTGSPGGGRIITTVLQLIVNVIDHGMNIAEATSAVRVHHQWLPDELRMEKGLSLDTIRLLEAKGHKISTQNAMGATQSIMRIDGRLYGASDPRRPGALTEGH